MDFKKVKEFIDLAKAEGVAELKYETKDCKIAVNFVGNTVQSSGAPFIPQAPTMAPSPAGEKAKSDNLHEIKSPFVGTFYSSPSPEKPTYVEVGKKISKGQTLCILEAMKIMNEIESDVAGEVVEICVDNESLVEFGQTLFKIRV